MSAITDGFNDRYMAVALSNDIYMVSTVKPVLRGHSKTDKTTILMTKVA